MNTHALPPTDVVLSTHIPGLKRHATGKVRDIYDLGDALLLVATDRISAFDVVLHQGIPDKGRVLTQLSAYWFETTRSVVDNHLLTVDDVAIQDRLSQAGVRLTDPLRRELAGRSMLCARATPLPIEAVVRGYLSGSAWKEYQARGQAASGDTIDLWGVSLPRDIRESGKLPQPIFTPSTKATTGHDLPVVRDEIARYLGDLAGPVEEAALRLYGHAAARATERGVLLADTKFEFGTVPGEGNTFGLLLIDEALTPDSSRFWDANTYAPGKPQPSFDKQFVRDFLESVPGWDKQPPAPDLPTPIVEKTAEKYRDAFRRITGRELPQS